MSLVDQDDQGGTVTTFEYCGHGGCREYVAGRWFVRKDGATFEKLLFYCDAHIPSDLKVKDRNS
jgi:hypothetical protein